MIRFSAALVAVAIGVLIGGIATSKLLLVYIAIVVSAVALLALAIGVVLKREELFGEEQGLVPAGAGAAPLLSARAGESQDQLRPAVPVPASAPFQGPTAAHGTAFAGTAVDGTAQAAPPVTAAPHQASDGRGRDRGAAPAPPWEAQSARDQWSSSPWQGSPEPGSAVADPAPDWMSGVQGASDPVGQARPAAPPSPSRASPAPSGPSGPSGAGPGSASPNWFAPQARSADVAPPETEASADAAPSDEDDDWPTRYSWLDDEADESSGGTDQNGVPADQAAGEDASDAARESEPPAQAGQALDPAGEAAEAGNAAAAADAGPEPGPVPPEPEPEPESAEPEAVSPDSEAPSAGTQDVVSGDDLVAVLQGVPRYHQPDCVLIRFMPGDDILRLPAEQAKADGCTPCAACQPAD